MKISTRLLAASLAAASLAAGAGILASCGSDAAVKPADSAAPATRPSVTVLVPSSTIAPVTDPTTTAPVTEPSVAPTDAPVAPAPTTPKTTVKPTTPPTTQAPPVSGSTSEVAQKFTGAVSDAANTAQTEDDPVYARIWARYQASGLTIRIPAGMYPPGTTATTPRDSLAYEISGGGQTWCLEKVGNPDTREFYYVQRDGGC